MVKFPVKVENVVAVAMLGVDVPIEKMMAETDQSEYEPEQFPGLVYRPTGLGVAALIFSSGKIVCTGAKSIELARQAVHKVADKIKEIGVDVPASFPIEIENIVAKSSVRDDLNLPELVLSLENAEYEPDQFPCLVYRITDPRVVFLLFKTGKIICTGAKSVEDIEKALLKLYSDLKKAGVKARPAKI